MGSLAVERWKERERRKEAQLLARGRAEGRTLGRTENLEFGRRLLPRLATRRFGDAAGERRSALLAGVSDPERLVEVGEAIIECGTGTDLLAVARRIVIADG